MEVKSSIFAVKKVFRVYFRPSMSGWRDIGKARCAIITITPRIE